MKTIAGDSAFYHAKVLSPGAERELAEITETDVKDLALVLLIEGREQKGLLRSKYVTVKKAHFPINTTKIRKITSISVVSYNGSDTIIKIGATSKAFCPIRGGIESSSTKSEHYSSIDDSQSPIDPYPPVKVLSPMAGREIGEMGIKDLSLALAIDKKGSIVVLRSGDVMDKSAYFPVTEAREITYTEPITVVQYEGSDCKVVKCGGIDIIVCPNPKSPE